MTAACPHILDLLTSDLAYDVFVPRTWTGIHMPPYHLDTKPGLPDFLKAHTRPIRETKRSSLHNSPAMIAPHHKEAINMLSAI